MIKAPKPENNFDFELCPAGTHIATLYKLVNIGTVKQEWAGVEKDIPKIRLYWELPEEPRTYEIEKDGKKEEVETIHKISQEYTLSLGEKAKLRPVVTGMIGTMSDEELYEFNIEDLLGKSCLLNVVHRKSKKNPDRTYAIVEGASPLLKSMEKPEQISETEVIDVNTATEEDLEKLSQNLREKIKSSKEWKQKSAVENNEEEIDPNDIPFD